MMAVAIPSGSPAVIPRVAILMGASAPAARVTAAHYMVVLLQAISSIAIMLLTVNITTTCHLAIGPIGALATEETGKYGFSYE